MKKFTYMLLGKVADVILLALSYIPIFSRFEGRQYMAIESNLNQSLPGAVRSYIPEFALNKHRIRGCILKSSDYRVIDANNLTDRDRVFIQGHGIALKNIEANKLCMQTILGREYVDIDGALNNSMTAFQRVSINTGNITAMCPITGVILQSNHSFICEPCHAIFYRFVGDSGVFYVAVGREGMGYVKLYIYIPDMQTILLLGDKDWAWLGRWEVDQFRAFLVSNFKGVIKNLNVNTKRKLCVLVDHPHFAHHIWNTLTGLQAVTGGRYRKHIDKIVITNEPMGPIEQIFPEYKRHSICRMSDNDFIEYALKNNCFIIRPGGTFVDVNITDRLYRVAVQNSPHEITKAAKSYRKAYWPILWATIRTGNRTWVSQAEGIAGIANNLKKAYPNFALIVDGYAIPYGKKNPSAHQMRLINKEEMVVKAIREKLDSSIEMYSIVGKPIFESVIFSRVIDLYLAHHGSLQHKIGWLSRKQGVVHSNKTVLAGIYGTKRYYAAFTSIEKMFHPVYMNEELVTDVAEYDIKNNLRWNDPLNNYDFKYNHALAELIKILKYIDNNHIDSPHIY